MIYTGRFRGAKVFKKENRQPVFHVAKSDEPKIGKSAVLRRHGLRRLISDIEGGVEKMAVVLEVPENRVTDMLEGNAQIDDGMAMHIEEMLSLSAGWLESQDDVPADVKTRLSQDVIDLIAEKADDAQEGDANLSGGEEDDWIFGETLAEASGREVEQELTEFATAIAVTSQEVANEAAAWADVAAASGDAGVQPVDPRTVRRAEVAAEEKERGLRATQGLLKISESFPGLRAFLVKHADMSEPTASRILSGDYPTKARRRACIESLLGLEAGELEAVSRDTIAKIFEGVATQHPELHQRIRRGRPSKRKAENVPPAAPVFPDGIAAGSAETDAPVIEPKAEQAARSCEYLHGVPAHPPIPAEPSVDDLAEVFLRRFERALEEGKVTDRMAYEMLGMLVYV